MSSVIAGLAIYLQVFGLITIAGGIVGWVKAKSRASIIGGTISGSLLIVAGYLVGHASRPGVFLGLFVSAALAARFGRAFAQSRKVMPAGVILLLAVVGAALSVLALVQPSS
jgi:uncharacterized membrane protein (UPF0136 family)